mmetsp:Transcript_18595/g.55293  ORF Transcript_18595/g.55293 Transcript_18595/m.55293 type:complete len:218 (+) Transcript_18595:3-656(+)
MGGMPGGIRIQVGGGPGGATQMFTNMGPMGGMAGMGAPRRRVQRRPDPPRFDCLQPGSRVVLCDLRSAADKNGDIGAIVRYDPQKGRYEVRLEEEEEVLSLKGANLQQILKGVVLTGITSSAALDGKSGTLLNRTQTASGEARFVVRLTAARQTVAVRGDNMILPKGALVALRGIQSKPALNGTKGLVQSWDSGAQRYVVRTQSEQLKLKLANVELA